VFEPTRLLDVGAGSQHGVGDVIRVLFRTEKDVVGEPNSLFVGGALADGAVEAGLQIKGCLAAPSERRPYARFQREERAFVNRFIEKAFAGNSFPLEHSQDRRAGNSPELLGQILEDELVRRGASLALVALGRRCRGARPYGT
jgi:hypothetical protein